MYQDNQEKLLRSFSIVSGFVVGAFLYVYLDFWSAVFFIIPVLYLSYLAANKRFAEPD